MWASRHEDLVSHGQNLENEDVRRQWVNPSLCSLGLNC